MRRLGIVIGLLLCAGVAFVLLRPAEQAPFVPVAETATTRDVAQGALVGFAQPDQPVHTWRGIPFAAPPVGDLRWRAPRPAAAWTGVRETLDNAPWCPQLRRSLDDGSSVDDLPLGTLMGQEDCLYLNVYAPAMSAEEAATADLPIMVWVHGGSNVWGRAEQYDASALVAAENVIVVVVQYRLGPLGWFAHPALRGAAETPLDASVNFALLDQIAALEWVRENGATFGGDTGNVTLFGESAGGHNVAALWASPLSEGLFHKVIIQSGLFAAHDMEEAEQTHPKSGKTIAPKMVNGAVTADSLRAAPLDAVFNAYDITPNGRDWRPPRIIEDGIVVPEGGMLAALNTPGGMHDVPAILGTNRDETKLFNLGDENLVKRRLGFVPIARDQEIYDAVAEYGSRMWRDTSVSRPAQILTDQGRRDVFAYRFDWDNMGGLLGSDFADLLGAGHALEIPFVFGKFTFLASVDRFVFVDKTLAERENLSRQMMQHWATFARTGDPSGAAGGEWMHWPDADGGANTMVFDGDSDGGVRFAAITDGWAQIAKDLAEDPRLDAPGMRCRAYQDVVFWDPAFADAHPMEC